VSHIAVFTSNVQCLGLAAGWRTEVGDATDQWRDQPNAATVCPTQWRSPASAGWLSWTVDVDRPVEWSTKQHNQPDFSPECLGATCHVRSMLITQLASVVAGLSGCLTFHKVVKRHIWGVAGSLVIVLLQIFSRFRQWKKFKSFNIWRCYWRIQKLPVFWPTQPYRPRVGLRKIIFIVHTFKRDIISTRQPVLSLYWWLSHFHMQRITGLYSTFSLTYHCGIRRRLIQPCS